MSRIQYLPEKLRRWDYDPLTQRRERLRQITMERRTASALGAAVLSIMMSPTATDILRSSASGFTIEPTPEGNVIRPLVSRPVRTTRARSTVTYESIADQL